MSDFIYSRGSNKFDNVPKQRTVGSFKEFANVVLSDTSKQKGETYVCADVKEGLHTDQEKYPGKNHWRQQGLALPRRFLAFDFDGFESPEVWEQLKEVFPWKAFFYTTASHTEGKPRARAFVELDREVDHDEGVELGEAAQRQLEGLVTLGKIEFDDSVYRSTQPIYTPVVGFKLYMVKGKPIDVDYLLTSHRAQQACDMYAQPVSAQAVGGRASQMLSQLVAHPEVAPEGQRNATLLSLAGKYRGQGCTEAAIKSQLLDYNQTSCKPPIEENEVLSICGRYSNQATVQAQPASIFLVDQHSANNSETEETHTEDSPKINFSLSDGDLRLPPYAPPPP